MMTSRNLSTCVQTLESDVTQFSGVQEEHKKKNIRRNEENLRQQRKLQLVEKIMKDLSRQISKRERERKRERLLKMEKEHRTL